MKKQAGGEGINLCGASRVILFDVNWSPATDMQALFRCYRYGQTRPVTVYRLVCEGCLEERMYVRAVNKLILSGRSVDKDPLTRWFRRGVDVMSEIALSESLCDLVGPEIVMDALGKSEALRERQSVERENTLSSLGISSAMHADITAFMRQKFPNMGAAALESRSSTPATSAMDESSIFNAAAAANVMVEAESPISFWEDADGTIYLESDDDALDKISFTHHFKAISNTGSPGSFDVKIKGEPLDDVSKDKMGSAVAKAAPWTSAAKPFESRRLDGERPRVDDVDNFEAAVKRAGIKYLDISTDPQVQGSWVEGNYK